MNPLFNKMAQTSQQASQPQIPKAAIAQVRSMMENLSMLQNPMQAIQKVAGQNPLLGSVMSLIGRRDPKQAFYEECQKQGVDPNVIINALNER
jgi:hypothetical protein